MAPHIALHDLVPEANGVNSKSRRSQLKEVPAPNPQLGDDSPRNPLQNGRESGGAAAPKPGV